MFYPLVSTLYPVETVLLQWSDVLIVLSIGCYHCRMADSDEKIVVLIGHSYVRRLNYSTSSNLGLHHDQVTVRYCCCGGASVRFSSSFHTLIRSSLMYCPTVVFIHIGENDIGSMSPVSLAERIISEVTYLLFRRSVPFVVVGQLLVWPSQRYPDDVLAAHRLLKAAIEDLPSDRVLYWRHRGFWGGSNRHLLFCDDNVHLSARGILSYSRSLRYAVRQAIARMGH